MPPRTEHVPTAVVSATAVVLAVSEVIHDGNSFHLPPLWMIKAEGNACFNWKRQEAGTIYNGEYVVFNA